MFTTIRLFAITACLLSTSARLSVSLRNHDYGHLRQNDILATHIKRVLDRMTSLKVTAHPRIRHLYELLQREMVPSGFQEVDKPPSMAHHQHSSKHSRPGVQPTSRLDLMPTGSVVDNHYLDMREHERLDFSNTLRPRYDVNKLNRIYTTTAEGGLL